jgi:DNA-binding CsgD family transcriptional regulator
MGASENSIWISGALGHTLAGVMTADPFAQLTPRERQCLEGVRDRLDVREISDRLGITINTVNTYLDSARRKLGAPTRNAAVRMLDSRPLAPSKSISGFDGIDPAAIAPPSPWLRSTEERRGPEVLRDAGAMPFETRGANGLPMPFPTRGRKRNDLALGQLLGLIAAIAFLAVLLVSVLVQTLLGLGELSTSLHNLF